MVVDLQRLLALREERQRVHAEFTRHNEECRAAAPHSYAVCQFRYQKLQDRLEELDGKIGVMLRAANRAAPAPLDP